MKISLFKYNAFLKVISLNSFSVLAKMIAGLVSIKVISVLLGPSALAVLGNFKNMIASVRSVATLGIQDGIVTYIASRDEDSNERAKILSTSFFGILIFSVILGAISVFFSQEICQYLFQTLDYKNSVFVFGLLLPLYGFHIFSVSVINGLRQFRALIFLSIIASVFSLILTLILIWLYKIQGALLALAIVESLVVLIYICFFIHKNIVFKDLKWSLVSRKYIKNLASYSLMALVTAIVFPFSMLYLRNLIIAEFGLEQAGLWEAINRISGYYLMILASGISMYYLPKLSRIEGSDNFSKEVRNYFISFIPFCIALLLIVFFTRVFLIKLIFSNDFLSVQHLLGYQLIGDFFKICSYAFGQQFLAKKLTIPYIITEVLFFIVYLLLASFLIVDYGIEGVLLSYLISYVFYFLMMLFYFRKPLLRGFKPGV